MAKPVVVFLDPHGPEARAAIQAECPHDVLLRMTASGNRGERPALVGDAEFFVGGITPIPASLIHAAPRLRLIHIRRVLAGEPVPARDLVSGPFK